MGVVVGVLGVVTATVAETEEASILVMTEGDERLEIMALSSAVALAFPVSSFKNDDNLMNMAFSSFTDYQKIKKI